MILPQASLAKLQTVHPDLRKVILTLAEESPLWFIVTEGVRTRERQKELFLARKTKTMNSRHLPHADDGLSRAVDLAVWEDLDKDKVVDVDELSWKFPKYAELAEAVQAIAIRLDIPVMWGGNWPTFKDGPHFELNRARYP